MNEKKNIDYSAADIERYHKGLMTAKEMNALEKAALDDPFLADAIEGYSTIPVQAGNDISILNNKLTDRINKEKIVPLKRISYTWLRVAAAIIIIAGAGLLTYNYVLKNKKQDVAATGEVRDPAKKQEILRDTVKQPIIDTVFKAAEKDKTDALAVENKGRKDKSLPISTENENEKIGLSKDAAPNSNYTIPEKSIDSETQNSVALNKADTIKQEDANGYLRVKTNDDAVKAKKETAQDKQKFLNEVTVTKGITAQNNKTNYFRGQVVDANNSPLPFANVTIVPDNIGTYTDVKGNFVLISPDSVLDVKIRSVGFENNNARLQNNIASNSIVLQQDTKNIPSTVLNTTKANTERKRQDNMRVEEPEPADGWYNYDTYIANNIKISDEIKTKTTPSSQVELSFEVNKYGEPVNIKVEKSVCKECDDEAIRLLKEGPKWKKKKKSKRAKVSVGFSQE